MSGSLHSAVTGFYQVDVTFKSWFSNRYAIASNFITIYHRRHAFELKCDLCFKIQEVNAYQFFSTIKFRSQINVLLEENSPVMG